MNDYNKIKDLIDNYKIISFDIFDTLLKRNTIKPIDIFELVEKKYNLKNKNKICEFKKLRIEAESIARSNSDKEDILLEDIYKEINLDDSVALNLMEIELNIEEEFLMQNIEMKKIYDYALYKGKEIIIISDMYLPKKFIESILNK